MIQLAGHPAIKKKVTEFISQSGHIPGLWVGFPAGGTYERQLVDVSLSHRCFPPSLSLSIPSSKNRGLRKSEGRRNSKGTSKSPQVNILHRVIMLST